MDPQFNKDDSLAAGTQRILEMQLVAALEYLKFPPERRDEGIHECRKCLKYARALLRLVAEGMPKRVFRKWNSTLRDAARCISELRDAKAIMECLDTLAAGADAVLCRAALAKRAGDATVPAEAAAEKAFLLISGRLTTPHDSGLGRGREGHVLRAGLRRSYAQGRRAMLRMRRKGGIESVHEWRKRAKDLRYQMAMLRPAWPAACGAYEGELHRLTDCLGHMHDVCLVETALAALPPGTLSEEALSAVKASAARSVEAAASGALSLGARIYSDKPGGFAARVAGWWAVWRDEPSRVDNVVEQDGEGVRHE